MARKTAATYESDLFKNPPPPPPLTDGNTSGAEATAGPSPNEVEIPVVGHSHDYEHHNNRVKPKAMKVKIPVSIVPKCGQLYAHWRSDEIISTEKGKEVKKQYFEPTQVPLPPPGASDQDVKAAWKLASGRRRIHVGIDQ